MANEEKIAEKPVKPVLGDKEISDKLTDETLRERALAVEAMKRARRVKNFGVDKKLNLGYMKIE